MNAPTALSHLTPAIALPAYQQYTLRAKAAQQQMQAPQQ